MSKTLQFSCRGKDIVDALKKLQGLMGAQLNAVLFCVNNNQLECHANINNRRGMIIIPAIIKNSGRFLVVKSEIEAIAKNRNELHFQVNDTTLLFKYGRYTGQLALQAMPNEAIKLLTINKNLDALELSTQLQTKIVNALTKCQLHNVYNTEQLSIFIQLRDKFIYVGIADQFHAALVEIAAKELSAETTKLTQGIMLPVEYSKILSQHFPAAAKIATQRNHIIFADDSAMVELPALQTQTNMLDNLLSIKAKYNSMLNIDEMNIILQNSPLQNADLFFILKKGSDQLKIKFTASNGNINDSITLNSKNKKNKKLRVDIQNLLDISGKLKGQVNFGYNNVMIQLQQDNIRYFSQLLQDKE